ncbi:MAG TPA: CsbD family protein [Terriglobales bacterium]|nr:CsbD family protein [Terriglobales bacterium]
MNKDELKGKFDQVKGKAKEKAGEMTDSPELQGEGIADQASGKVREGFGAAKRKVSDTVEDLRDDD